MHNALMELPLDSQVNKTGDVWHICIQVLFLLGSMVSALLVFTFKCLFICFFGLGPVNASRFYAKKSALERFCILILLIFLILHVTCEILGFATL